MVFNIAVNGKESLIVVCENTIMAHHIANEVLGVSKDDVALIMVSTYISRHMEMLMQEHGQRGYVDISKFVYPGSISSFIKHQPYIPFVTRVEKIFALCI